MRRFLAWAAAAGALAGCAANGPRQPPSDSALFSQDCGKCHSLIGNESRHTQGGDLLGYDLSPVILAQFTREMPVRRRLSASQLTAIVRYVYDAEQRSRSGRAP
ncbi:MAG: cytochrome c [Solirubrobacteraceae bacterium]|jgi:hypothetical protein